MRQGGNFVFNKLSDAAAFIIHQFLILQYFRNTIFFFFNYSDLDYLGYLSLLNYVIVNLK